MGHSGPYKLLGDWQRLQSKMFISAIIIVVIVQVIHSSGFNRCLDQATDGEGITQNIILTRSAVNKRSSRVLDVSEEFFQGDIVLTDNQKNLLSNHREMRTGVRDVVKRWPKNESGLVIVPYYIDLNSGYTKRELQIIKAAMKSIQTVSCIKFVPRYDEEDFIIFFSGRGCYATLGRVGGMQAVSIKRGECVKVVQVTHEILHALGFTHMHNRQDRDEFIQIYPDNLGSGNWLRHFDKIDSRLFNDFGTPYDLLSVMHYPKTAFAKARHITILPCNSTFDDAIGNVREMSRGDIERLTRMYEC